MTVDESKTLKFIEIDKFLTDKWGWGLLKKYNREYNIWKSDNEMKSELGFVYVKIKKYFTKHPEKVREGEDLLKLFHFSLRNHLNTMVSYNKKVTHNNGIIMWCDLSSEIDIDNLENKSIYKYYRKKRIGNKLKRILTPYIFSGERKERMDNSLSLNEIKYLMKILNISDKKSYKEKLAQKPNTPFWNKIRTWVENPDDCFSNISESSNICEKCKVNLECKEATNWKYEELTKSLKEKIEGGEIKMQEEKLDEKQTAEVEEVSIKEKAKTGGDMNEVNNDISKKETDDNIVKQVLQELNLQFKDVNNMYKIDSSRILFDIKKKLTSDNKLKVSTKVSCKEYFQEKEIKFKENKGYLAVHLLAEQLKELCDWDRTNN